ncbi:RNA-binding S4 domain-containing protein [bacterium SCSIO 12643]|nr:RNA-binding S4 domain-containing protein [bacterium SCSIO 12643]
MRIDKYLWCIRLFKTRSLATKAVKDGKIMVNEKVVKASKELETNDSISIKYTPTVRVFKVLGFPKSRVGAKLVPDYMKEITPQENLDLLNEINQQKKVNSYFGIKGRPTKRDRRNIMKTLEQRNYYGEDES